MTVRPAARTCRNKSSASSHFRRKSTVPGTCAPARRAGSAVQVRGRYKAADQPGAHAGPERRRDRDLAVADLAQRAVVDRPRDTDRVVALLGKARVVEQQHAATFGQLGPQDAPHRRRRPRRVGDEMLEGLIVGRRGQPRDHRLHGLAGAVARQPAHVMPQRDRLRRWPEHAWKGVSHCINRRSIGPGSSSSTAAQRTWFSEIAIVKSDHAPSGACFPNEDRDLTK